MTSQPALPRSTVLIFLGLLAFLIVPASSLAESTACTRIMVPNACADLDMDECGRYMYPSKKEWGGCECEGADETYRFFVPCYWNTKSKACVADFREEPWKGTCPLKIAGPSCDTAGPQAPRDIDDHAGENSVTFTKAPPATDLHLCDIHFHKYAEHKAAGYPTLAGDSDRAGYVCKGHEPEAHASHEAHGGDSHGCAGIAGGDTVEVHWVFTTCDVQPAPTLGSCFSYICKNPELRVEAKVFYLTDEGGANFGKLAGADSLPDGTGAVEYLCSTTGTSYTNKTCSPYQVTWNVRPECSALNLASLNHWCDNNVYKEDHAHGVRPLVTPTALLAPIRCLRLPPTASPVRPASLRFPAWTSYVRCRGRRAPRRAALHRGRGVGDRDRGFRVSRRGATPAAGSGRPP